MKTGETTDLKTFLNYIQMKVKILLSNGQELQDLVVKFSKSCSESVHDF